MSHDVCQNKTAPQLVFQVEVVYWFKLLWHFKSQEIFYDLNDLRCKNILKWGILDY